MSKFTDRRYLLAEQYRDATNLQARIALHKQFSTNPYPLQRWVFDHLDLPIGGCILELGCGPGTLWRENRARIPARWHVTLSDFSPGMLEHARRNLRDLPHPFQFAVVDAQAIPFADGSFDAVIANGMLYHVPDRERAYAEIRRVLRPGGRLYASTNGRAHLRELARTGDPVPAAPATGAKLGFALENGAGELARWFAAVALHRYEDTLVVTEAEPLVTYLLSTTGFSGLESTADFGDLRARLTAFVQSEVVAHGAIHITKETGMFEATRGDSP